MNAKIEKFYNIALRYLAIRERCSFEMNAKLLKAGASQEEANDVIKHLEAENFLNNQRFAKAYSNDKFKYGGWGKKKIQTKLKLLKISDEDIEEALNYINDDDYLEKAKKIGSQKLPYIKAKNDYEKKQKLMLFLYSKGFSSEICRKVTEELLETRR